VAAVTTKPRADEPKTEVKATPVKPDEHAHPPADPKPAGPRTDATGRETDCVVDDGTDHMGGATHGGQVCSAHAMHYHSDGTRRGA
jgi:hypothetical protein